MPCFQLAIAILICEDVAVWIRLATNVVEGGPADPLLGCSLRGRVEDGADICMRIAVAGIDWVPVAAKLGAACPQAVLITSIHGGAEGLVGSGPLHVACACSTSVLLCDYRTYTVERVAVTVLCIGVAADSSLEPSSNIVDGQPCIHADSMSANLQDMQVRTRGLHNSAAYGRHDLDCCQPGHGLDRC